MKNIKKLIKNTDFSFDMQSRLFYHIQKCSIAIDRANKAYVQGKKLLTETDAALIKAIVEDDYEKKEAAERDIINIVKSLGELRHVIKEHTAKNRSFFKMVMNHQVPATELQDVGELVGLPKFPQEQKEEAKQPSEHIYVLPRKQVFEILKALSDGIKAQPDFKALEIAISTGYLKK
jgi:hypothetical protein